MAQVIERPSTTRTHRAPMARKKSAKLKSDTSITMRISAPMRNMIDAAAASVGKSRTEFVLDCARQQAVDTLLDRRVFDLDEDASEAFARALAEPVPANDALRALMQKESPWE